MGPKGSTTAAVAIQNATKTILQAFADLNTKVTSSIESQNTAKDMLDLELFSMASRIKKIEEMLIELKELSIASPECPMQQQQQPATEIRIEHPKDSSNKDIKLSKEHIDSFIQEYGPNPDDDKSVKTIRKELGRYIRWATNDTANTILDTANNNNQLPSWKKMRRQEKNALLQIITEEAIRLKLPVNRCNENWFIVHLVYECWRNKIKYHNRKDKKDKEEKSTGAEAMDTDDEAAPTEKRKGPKKKAKKRKKDKRNKKSKNNNRNNQ
ncbi:hypothetical protein INT45_014319 [Circinella minor]|uniref:Uncharacterized protein n=1 Tax=Circinella minor TaxID=1195481 RepID=A0A8H7VE93_9FUNG|nr:hypothetical protein INT45_014319 [Circinella minor]